MLKVYGIFDESLIAIAICPSNKENFINIDVANHVQVQESMKNESNEDQIEVPLQIDDYHFAAHFTVVAIEDHLMDIMLGYNWLERLVTFSVNAKKKCITFFHEKKKITLQDFFVVVLVSQTTDEESTDGRYEELEEEINILNKLIMDKDNELVQV